jgi:hypothetical protein
VRPNYVTIITPFASGIETCKEYLLKNAEPSFDHASTKLQCKKAFQFDRIASLHFCSFLVVDAEDGFSPSLIFEATFDGNKDEFLCELLRVASEGLHQVYRHCAGYPASGRKTPELVKEYFVRHDVGAHTFFSGSPGRTVSQIQGEDQLRTKIVSFLSKLSNPPSLPTALLALVREFVRGNKGYRWAEQPVPFPWEMKSRIAIVVAAVAAVWLLALCLGLVFGMAAGFGPGRLYHMMEPWFDTVGYYGAEIDGAFVTTIPWVLNVVPHLEPATAHMLTAVTVVWLIVRVTELFLISWSKALRDQRFFRRFLLHLVEIFRYALIAILAGTVVLGIVSGISRPAGETTVTIIKGLITLGQLILLGIAILALNHYATSLRLAVQFRPAGIKRENIRRLKLDLTWYAMAIAASVGVLLVARLMPAVFDAMLGHFFRVGVFGYFVVVVFTMLGILIGYLAVVLGFAVVRALELMDGTKLAEPAGLIKYARKNVSKYSREEGGTNRYQNHLASITHVKPGVLRHWLLRLTLLAINLLCRLWFNRGELGGIPTILSARWVMIDRGRRLLFLDNYSGAWDSYLNEFIDLQAVKGLNAIWSNTFLKVGRERYNFPPTRFLFWLGAQDALPFKAYVRQSQIKTIAWYSSYPTLNVANINANTELRQSLFQELSFSAADEIIQKF